MNKKYYKLIGEFNDESWTVGVFESEQEAQATRKTAQKKALTYWKKHKYDMRNTTDPNWKADSTGYTNYVVEEVVEADE